MKNNEVSKSFPERIREVAHCVLYNDGPLLNVLTTEDGRHFGTIYLDQPKKSSELPDPVDVFELTSEELTIIKKEAGEATFMKCYDDPDRSKQRYDWTNWEDSGTEDTGYIQPILTLEIIKTP